MGQVFLDAHYDSPLMIRGLRGINREEKHTQKGAEKLRERKEFRGTLVFAFGQMYPWQD